MKTLTATADRLRQRRDAELRWVLAVTLYRDRFGSAPTSTTYYLSDRPRAKVTGGAGVLGQDWLPLVRDWGALARGLEMLRPGATPATLDLVLTNTAPIGGIARFTSLLRQGLNTSGADLAFGDAVLSVVFVEGTTEAAIPIAHLQVDDLTSVTEETVTLRCNGRETLLDIHVVAGAYADDLPFYQFMIASGSPTVHGTAGAKTTSLTVAEFDYAAYQDMTAAGAVGGDRWWVFHRNPVTHPGDTCRLLLRQNSGAVHGAYDVVAREATFNADSLSAAQAITWNTPPTIGDILTSLHFADSGWPPGVAPDPGAYVLDIPVEDVGQWLLRIENHTPGGGPSSSNPRAFSRDFTVEFL